MPRTRDSKDLARMLTMGVGMTLLAACGGEPWIPAAGPTEGRGFWVQGADVPRAGEKATIFPLELGSKPPMQPGLASGYELVSKTPSNYRFRWTGDFVSHPAPVGRHFQGSVWTAGHFTSVTPGCDDGSCALEEGEDHLSGIENVAGGQRIVWDTVVWNGWDGFSFTTDAEPLYLELLVDGTARPDLLDFRAAGRTSAPAVGVELAPAQVP
jgi:hypothetical protein